MDQQENLGASKVSEKYDEKIDEPIEISCEPSSSEFLLEQCFRLPVELDGNFFEVLIFIILW